MKVSRSALLVLCSLVGLYGLAGTCVAQRPKNVEEAARRFEQVRDQAERNRHRAVRDLGRFGEDRSTSILLAELQRAETISYRRTVVRAIGYKQRRQVVAPLVLQLARAVNPRMADTIANALRRQGPAGISGLVESLAKAARPSRQRTAICYALGRVTKGDEARDALLADLQRSGGLDRLPPLRGLAARQGDDAVDAMRVNLAGDKATLIAATALAQLAKHRHADAPKLAVGLSRRLAKDADADRHAAVLAGLLVMPQAQHYPALLVAAARANDAFGKDQQVPWRRAFADGQLLKWLEQNAAGQKFEGARVAAARALLFTPAVQRPAAIEILATLLQQRQPAVVQAAATSLALLDDGLAVRSALSALLKKGGEVTGAIAIACLHPLRQDEASWHDELLSLSKHKRVTLRTAALRALCTTKADSSRLLAAAQINLDHRSWSVRSAAIELLVATRSAKSPPLLFDRLDKEDSRVREDLRTALLNLTGLQFATTKEWRNWWSKEGETFEPRAANAGRPGRNGESGATAVRYWDIPVRSDRVVFVVDVSGSMSQPFGTANHTRLDEAKQQLGSVFGRLPKKAKVNVITFQEGTTPLFDKLRALDKKRRKLADAFVAELAAKGPTNVHRALELAFLDRDIDTIFLLTDGRPSVGAIVNPDALAEEVARWNIGRSIRIHTIAIGEKSPFLARLAADSGGQHSVAR